MEKKTPYQVVKDSIEMMPVLFDYKSKDSEYVFNLIMGRIVGFVESGLLTKDEMDYFIDYALNKYNEINRT